MRTNKGRRTRVIGGVAVCATLALAPQAQAAPIRASQAIKAMKRVAQRTVQNYGGHARVFDCYRVTKTGAVKIAGGIVCSIGYSSPQRICVTVFEASLRRNSHVALTLIRSTQCEYADEIHYREERERQREEEERNGESGNGDFGVGPIR
jgi:hypothetical protein